MAFASFASRKEIENVKFQAAAPSRVLLAEENPGVQAPQKTSSDAERLMYSKIETMGP